MEPGEEEESGNRKKEEEEEKEEEGRRYNKVEHRRMYTEEIVFRKKLPFSRGNSRER
jgi:hypothetical protein